MTDASGKRQGFWRKVDTAGKKIYEGHFRDNIPVGEFRYYYPNGKIKVVSIMSGNGKKARSVAYFPGGKKMAEGIYINEQRDSTWRFYSEYDGQLVSEESYKNGKKEGFSLTYYGGDGIAERSNWKNGVIDGIWEQYYTDGKIKLRGNYRNGLRDGQVRTFFGSGQMMMDGQYSEGDPEGRWFYYDETGKLLKKETYLKGKLTGTEVMK
jgi:antitoxin component YwqK of YwqJK toxin-antitoxin module